MKTINILLIALTLLTTISCSKKSTVTIQAHNLVNPSDGSHYANKRFVITEISYKLFGQSKGKTVVDSYFNENGYANFDLKMKKNKDYMVDIQNLDNICYLDLKTDDFLDHNSTVNIDFNYAPCGYLSIPSKNINCEGPGDKMQFKYYYTNNPDVYYYTGYTTGANHVWDDYPFIEGCADYTNVTPPAIYGRPAGNYTIEWRVIRPSGTTTGIDYFTVTEGDTLTYVLEY